MSSVQRKPPRGKFNFPHKHLDLRRRRRQLKCKYSSRLGASRAQGLVIANTADYRREMFYNSCIFPDYERFQSIRNLATKKVEDL
uniref:Uncharacterized protein n=1 Tax=Trichogramma kaykai TaxID=54128 RepID=A0ABD2VZ78_9HYME